MKEHFVELASSGRRFLELELCNFWRSSPRGTTRHRRGGVLPVLLADISCWVCPIALRSAQGKVNGMRMKHSRVSLSDLRGICQCFCSRLKGGTIEKCFSSCFALVCSVWHSRL